MATSLSATADELLGQAAPAYNPVSPAGITDTTRQGWMYGLEGLGRQAQAGQDYSDSYGGYADTAQNFVNQLLGNWGGGNSVGGFSSQNTGGGGGGSINIGAGAEADPYYGSAENYYSQAGDPTQFQRAAGLTGNALNGYGRGMNQAAGLGLDAYGTSIPGFGAAADLAGNAVAQYGGGFDRDIANLVNQTGGSFDPYANPALLDTVSQANQQLARNFNQSVMPQMNQAAIASGSGGYGGSRAGVAQGMREQSLADAMQRQTTELLSSGYEAGLNRYVQDRASTLGATTDASRLGSEVGLSGASQLANIAGTAGNLGLDTSQNLSSIYDALAGRNLAQGQQVGDIASMLGELGISAGQGYADIGNTLTDAATSRANAQAAAQASMSNAGMAAGASRYASDSTRYINELAQQNDMLQFGLGDLLPSALSGNYGAGTAAGQTQQDLGDYLAQIGLTQQSANQNDVSWLNEQANYYGGYEDQAFNNWTQQMNPILGTSGQSSTGTANQSGNANLISSAAQGAATGTSLYDMYNNANSGSNVNANSGANASLGGSGSFSGIGGFGY